MISKINLAFSQCKKENRPALLTYTVAGDNTKKKSLEILNAIAPYVDILEIGIPHNTPVADGGQIQTSAYRAIKNGIKVGYYNTIFQLGERSFLKHCKQSGVDGLIVVDLPWPENKNFANKCKKQSINFIQLLSPTTSDIRMKNIIKDSHDMVYYISMLSTTGGTLKVSAKEILKNYNKIKKINPKQNVVIGFGITEKTISSLTKADGLVVGSALCKAISGALSRGTNPVRMAENMVKKLRSKII
jgi:tryptophan synthase alpha chain